MAWWYAPDVSDWRVIQAETRGVRDKKWVVDGTGQRWLRKSHLARRPFEPTIEVLTLELGPAVWLRRRVRTRLHLDGPGWQPDPRLRLATVP